MALTQGTPVTTLASSRSLRSRGSLFYNVGHLRTGVCVRPGVIENGNDLGIFRTASGKPESPAHFAEMRPDFSARHVSVTAYGKPGLLSENKNAPREALRMAGQSSRQPLGTGAHAVGRQREFQAFQGFQRMNSSKSMKRGFHICHGRSRCTTSAALNDSPLADLAPDLASAIDDEQRHSDHLDPVHSDITAQPCLLDKRDNALLLRSSRARHSLCPCCSRRNLLAAAISFASAASIHQPAAAVEGGLPALGNADSLAAAVLAAKRGRPEWVDELYAFLLGAAGDTYEAKVGELKQNLFAPLVDLQQQRSASKPLDILEIGVGSGPNFKFYAEPGLRVIGLDPNKASEKYAEAAAAAAGLEPGRFSFLQGVGEGIPLESSSLDVVVTTLVLCSVADVERTISEVFRVLRPGGQYFFLEHVAAPEGTSLRFWQDSLDPLQQFVADGCHLTREPLPAMEAAGFAKFDTQHLNIEGLSLLAPHLVGRAFKA